MKNFILGTIVGVVIASTGAYAIIEQKAKKLATTENAAKATNAAQNFIEEMKDILK